MCTNPLCESKRHFPISLFALALVIILAVTARAQTFRINEVRIGPDGRIVLQHTADTNSYYILLRGDQVTAILTAKDMQFGIVGTNQLKDPNLATNAGFYRIRQVPLSSPLDTDGDGIDDVCEIKYRPLLDPLNANDANLDPDDDGRTTLEECGQGRNPFVADLPEVTTISYPTNATTASFVIFSGVATTNTLIRVEGGAAYITNAVGAGGAFDVTVALNPNRLNRLFISAVDEFGNVSAPVPIDILQDSVAPYLFIDFPTNGAVLTTSNTLVAGRVGDALSGFLGLSVTVNGVAANVDVGIGPNGTYQRGGVPLNVGTNQLTVMASDRLGNSITKNVTVVREEPAGPRLLAVSGDLQQTNILRRLAAPLVIKVTEAGGSPRANQLVNFQVTRSDGRLLPVNTNQLAADITTRADYSSNGVMFVQLFTDANGEARVWWTMGTDAGHANNRVTVSSAGLADTVFFCASATALPAKQINIGSGNNQRGEMSGHAAEPLKVWVSDGNNPVAGVPVTFRVVQGDGELVPIVDDDGASPAGPGLRGSRPTGSIALKRVRAKGGVQASEVTVLTSITGHAEVDWIFGDVFANQSVQATFAGNTGLPVTFNATALARVPGQPTMFTGLIQDNALQPIGRVFCELKVAGATLAAFSDAQGRFAFADIPSGAGHLLIDGSTALTLGTNAIPSNSFPALQYTIAIVPNAENSLPTPVLLPRLNTNNAKWYYGTNDLVVTCEGIAGLKMFIKANSMKHPNGEIVSPGRPALVSLNQVHHDDIPMPMPDGASPPFAWTLQPGGATFDPPVQVEYPNMSGLAPGAAAFFLTFNHDTERFEIVASGHVTEDGSKIVCDPGAGLTISGWGCNCPPYSVTGECDKCEGPAGLAKAPGDHEFTDKDIRANPNIPLDSRQCGQTPMIFPETETVGTCECSAGPDGPRTKIRIQVRISVKDKWYNANITNQADIAYITQHENHHVAIARDFYDKAVGLAVTYNDRDYDTEAACQLNVQEFVKKYAELEKKHDAEQRAHDNEEERRKCNAILARHGLPRSPSPFAGNAKDESDDHGDHFIKIVEQDLWTLTVNGQTRTVNGLDSFRIGNVAAPDLFGAGGPGSVPDFLSDDYVRLTGHSTTGGVTRYVFSEPFRVRQGQAVQLGALTITEFPPPSTESLRVAPDNPTLTTTGQTTQVRATATLNDGSTLDVTLRERWTTYRSSNPGVLTVDPDGLATARSKGMVFVTAVNEGATAVCQIDVSPGDPLTVVRGFIRDTNGIPFSGVTINLIGLANEPLITGSDGGFVFTNVPTAFGALRIFARLITPTNAFFATLVLDPVAGGITDAGSISLRQGVAWIGGVSGVWHGTTNWSNGQVPGPSTDVYISAPPGVTVTISQGANVVNNLVLQSPLRITGGSLRAVGPIQAFSPIQLAGGQLQSSIVDSLGLGISATSGTLSAMVLNCDLDALNGGLTVVNGLTLNGVVRLGHPTSGTVGTLAFNGSQALTGSGSVLFGNSGCNALRIPLAGTTLTNRVFMHGQNGQIGWSTCSGGVATSRLVNEGTIAADVAAGTITVRGSPVLNHGQLLAGAGTLQIVGLTGNLGTGSVSAGGHLNVTGTYTNNLVLPVNGGTLTLDGDWFNAGELRLTNTTLNLDGTFGLEDLGTIVRVGGSVRVTGLLQGAGGTLVLNDTTGSWLMNGGTLRQITVESSGGALLQSTSGTLDAVTLDSNLDVLNGTLNVVNGLVLNGVARIGHPTSGTVGTLAFNGSQALSGTGSILFGNSGCNSLRIPVAASTLTNRVFIHGQYGQIGWSTCSGGTATSRLINEGTIAADAAAGTITVRGSPVLNAGQLLAGPGTLQIIGLAGNLGTASVSPGGHLNVAGTYTNNLVLPVNGGTLTLDGDWFNAGELRLTNTTFNLDGTFGLEDLGTITRSGGSVRVTGLLVGAGGTLILDDTTGSWLMNGGTLRQLTVSASGSALLQGTSGTLDAVTLDSNLDLLNGSLNVVNGLVLNGVARLGHPTSGTVGTLIFNGSQGLGGTGSVLFGNSGCNALRIPVVGTTLTNRVLIHGQNGQIGYSTCSGGVATSRLVNEGTIAADVAAGTITVRGSPVLNYGQFLAGPGTLQIIGLAGNLGTASVSAVGHLNVAGTYTNDLVLPVNGGTLTLDGDWFNAGELRLTNSTFNLDGTFGLEDLGTITRVGGSVRVTGLLQGAGGTLVLDGTTGPWLLNGGTLRQLTVSASGSGLLQGASGTLDAVTLDSSFDVLNGTLNVVNGLVLNGVARIGHPTSGTVGTLIFNGSQAISGGGSVLFGNSGCNTLRVPLAGTTLTNRVLIHGHSGQIGYSTCSGGVATSRIVNEGTISADLSAGTITVRGTPVLNHGQLLASVGTLQVIGLAGNLGNASVSAGAHLSVDGTYTNNLVLPVIGGRLTLNGNWFNGSELLVTNSTLALAGSFGLGDLGTIHRSGGFVDVTGTLDGDGGTLELNAATGVWNVNGGTLREVVVHTSDGVALVGVNGTLDGVTIDGDLYVPNGTLNVVNGLVLNGLARIGHATSGTVGTLIFNGSQALSGSGSVLFGNSGCNTLRVPLAGTTLTNRVLIHGQNGQIGYSTCSGGVATSRLVNEGTIAADVAAGTITVRGSPVLNHGQLLTGPGTLQIVGLAGNLGTASVSAVGHLNVTGTYTNNMVLPVNGGTLTLDGDWFNAGELRLTNSTFNLDGTFGLEDLGTITRLGGSVRVTGLLQGAGSTLVLDDTTGSWLINGGTLRQLTVSSSGSALLQGASGTLDAVTLGSNLDVLNGSLNVVNGLVLNGVARIGHPSSGTVGTLIFNGGQALRGSGSVLFGNSGCNALRVPLVGTTLTNRVLIHGHSGQIGYSTCSGGVATSGLVNEGTLSANVSGGTITVRAVFINNGNTNSLNGGILRINP